MRKPVTRTKAMVIPTVVDRRRIAHRSSMVSGSLAVRIAAAPPDHRLSTCEPMDTISASPGKSATLAGCDAAGSVRRDAA
jgi:hypothetical protein